MRQTVEAGRIMHGFQIGQVGAVSCCGGWWSERIGRLALSNLARRPVRRLQKI